MFFIQTSETTPSRLRQGATAATDIQLSRDYKTEPTATSLQIQLWLLKEPDTHFAEGVCNKIAITVNTDISSYCAVICCVCPTFCSYILQARIPTLPLHEKEKTGTDVFNKGAIKSKSSSRTVLNNYGQYDNF